MREGNAAVLAQEVFQRQQQQKQQQQQQQ